MVLLCDFETISDCPLEDRGGRLYSEDPSTEVLCATLYDVDTRAWGVWFPGDAPVHAADTLVAHNATDFDRHVARNVAQWTGSWADSSVAARRAGLPGALDALGTRWLGLPKDAVASKFTRALSKFDDIADAPCPTSAAVLAIPDKSARGKARARELKAWRSRPVAERRHAVMRIVVDYCASDVAIIAHGWDRLEPFMWRGVFGGWEGDVLSVDTLVNERGICFDAELARALLAADATNSEREIESSARVLGWSVEQTRAAANSPQQFAQLTGRADAQRETVDAILAQDGFEVPWIVALAKARRALATIASGKLTAGLARTSPDGRMRDTHRYYGAHTGRWSGRGMQLQNLTKPGDEFEKWGDVEIAGLIERALRGDALSAGEITVGLRACLRASPGHELAVCDFSGVEARALAWCAGDAKALEVFASGRNPYRVMAAVIFGVSYDDVPKGSERYKVGKVAELMLGYAAGHRKFYENNGPALDAAGVDAAAVVKAWRALHAPIVRYWRALEDAFVDAVRGRASRVWPFEFAPSTDGKDVAIFLPSGRPIVYNAVGLSREIGFNGRERLSPYYVGTKGPREHLYGGKIAENVIQAMCRDLMADALVRAEEDRMCPVLHVHDEIVCDVPRGREGYEALHRVMTTLPEWAEGFPIGAAGHWGLRYRK